MDIPTQSNAGGAPKNGSRTLFLVIIALLIALIIWYMKANPVVAPGGVQTTPEPQANVSDAEIISALVEDIESAKPTDFSKELQDIEASIHKL